jgi:hypothetical protein
MKVLFGIAAAATIFLSPLAMPSTAAAKDSWGCSHEKCLVACQKAGGQRCSTYCDKALRDKQVSKVCK